MIVTDGASVIIPSWNGRHLLERNLPSVMGQTYRPYEVIVVDNGSKDGSVDWLRRTYPDIRLLALPKNVGFAPANNLAWKEASGEFIVTLNNDARPTPRWLEHLARAAKEHPEAGVLASLLITSESEKIDAAGDDLSCAAEPIKRGVGRTPEEYSTLEDVFGACGGAALYRRSMLEQVGFFDEDFFACHEDIDLAFRARLAGWRVLYVPQAILTHEVGATLGKLPTLNWYLRLRNIEWVLVKNMPFRLLIKYALPIAMKRIYGLWVAKRALKNQFGHALRAKWDALVQLPRMCRKRNRIQRGSLPAASSRIDKVLVREPLFRWNYWKDLVRQGLRW